MRWIDASAFTIFMGIALSLGAIAQQNSFNVFCDTLDPGTASCKILPRGPRIECFAASGGIPQCIEPDNETIVNCVPYQLQTGGNYILQMSCSRPQADLSDPVGEDALDPNSFGNPFGRENSDTFRNRLTPKQ